MSAGSRRETRDVDGLLILDKPSGLTSNKSLQKVKHLLQAAKAGHTGSLDPLASGVLPLCFGEATKISRYLLDSDKTYRARIKLGVTTTTGDSEGEVLAEAPVPQFARATLEQILQEFRGTITQQPSNYSALKQNGVPLYKLARAGKPIEPKFRDVEIYSITLLAWEWPEFDVEVSCSKGTYIRTLAEDIGRKLGCGAHLTALRRLKAGPFTLADSLTLEQMQALAETGALDAQLVAADKAIDAMPEVQLDAAQTRRLRQGQHVALDGLAATPEIRVYCGAEFIGIGELDADGILSAKRLLGYESC
jgi:tRNA pseudouridine55 synthase